MLMDLLQLREAGIDPSDVDLYIDERRAVHDAAFPPRHAGEAVIRRFFAAVARTAPMREPGRGAAWARLRGLRAGPRRGGSSTAWTPRARPRSLGAVGFDWYDPVASHAMRCPGRRTRGGRAGVVVRAGLWDVAPHPAGCAPGA